ncbi:MAG: PorT family protein [Paludibacteraceae bacterium]|nr:PorT family protein [Paludibacteraceae bacterium]
MKKGLFILSLIFICSCASAQYKFKRPELYVGTNQGVALWTHVGFDPIVEQSFDVRYHGGITVRYIIQKYFGIQAELNYTQRGWSEKSSKGERYSHKLDYLELPLVSHIMFGSRTFKFYVHLGPKIRVLVNDYATTPFSENPGVQQTKKIESKFDYSVFGGIGVEYRTKWAGAFFFEMRYDYGLGNIFSVRKGEDFSKANNQAVTISVGFLFDVLSRKDYYKP